MNGMDKYKNCNLDRFIDHNGVIYYSKIIEYIGGKNS